MGFTCKLHSLATHENSSHVTRKFDSGNLCTTRDCFVVRACFHPAPWETRPSGPQKAFLDLALYKERGKKGYQAVWMHLAKQALQTVKYPSITYPPRAQALRMGPQGGSTTMPCAELDVPSAHPPFSPGVRAHQVA